MKWHEACLSISAAILEILNAWENGVLAFVSIQKITDNIKGKVCSLAVCAVAWLVAHVRMLGLDEREKSLQMIRQLAGPLFSENTLQFYNESSNEDDANVLSSPSECVGWRHAAFFPGCSFPDAAAPPLPQLEASLQLVREANLFLLISSILGSRTAGPHTQFVQWFMEECVDCLEQGGRGSVLQFLPFTTHTCHQQSCKQRLSVWQVSELVKVSAMSSPKVVLAITDLSLPLGRQVAAKAIAAL
ncbi:hypothetical protein P7K49_010491 [Saguinus oedipus]|uniref:Mediator of RNA polymerase II transcription subunit 24 n=1 Tax=Saguinus oedipus TaxID=9490 RepID=A0ABQ9VNS5_SAGOE|nr:hypothetical protein P7K49_010491 [Saguinus oedipus]